MSIELYNGDCLEVMDKIDKNSIDLIYIDPPFGIKQDEKFNMIPWKKTKHYEKIVYDMFEKILNENDLKFLSFLYPRLKKMRELLSEKGSIYVHIDWHVGHYVKILLDDIFGKENFLNEIIWSYGKMASSSKRFMANHDVIFFYKKSKDNYFIVQKTKLDKPIKRLAREMVNGVLKNARDEDGNLKYVMVEEKTIDNNWSDIPRIMPASPEFLTYATQKPEKILERMILSSCPENGIVADFFGGSGTTISVAKKLGRKGIYCDQNKIAFNIAKDRIENTKVEKSLFE